MADTLQRRRRVDLSGSLSDLHKQYARTRDRAVREHLLERHAPLAQHLAARFGPRAHQSKDDVLQVAYIGLIKALEGFDPERGFAFSTYATRTIIGELKRNLRDRGWALRPGRGIHDRYLAIESCVDDLTQVLGRVPTVPEVAQQVGMTVDAVLEAREAATVRTLDSIDGHRPGVTPPSESLGATDEAFERVDRRLTVEQLLKMLDAEERHILHLRFVDGLSQAQIAREMETSQMHVSRMLRRLYDRLRPALDGGQVADRQAAS